MDSLALIKEKGLSLAIYEIENTALKQARDSAKTHAEAARVLGLKRTTYIMMLQKHGLYVSKRKEEGYKVIYNLE